MSIATTPTAPALEAIPSPPAGLLGHLGAIDPAAPVQSMMRLARENGPIFRLTLPGRSMLVVSGQALVNELCDERRFDKLVSQPLKNVRAFAGDGLFTAWSFEANWRKAHTILLPNFSQQAMRGYMPAMADIAEQLVLKWARLNPADSIDVADDMTRLTLDTIGLCGFGYRFNSFYREEAHPFVQAMAGALGEAMGRVRRPAPLEGLRLREHRAFAADIAAMNELVDRIIRERKADPAAGQRDLLGYMLSGVDKESGQGLDDVNIRYQIITFLIAGHETTSGLLAFTLYYLTRHPDVLARAYAEVDALLGGDAAAPPSYAQVMKLGYLSQILKETLRLWPTAPAFSVYPLGATVIGGRYRIAKDDKLQILLPNLHRDPTVWGADADAFRPERFAPEREAALPPNAYKPFGNGARACIGRQFAMQEALLVLAMILQRFELVADPAYELKVKETLTLKPDGFRLRVRPRADRPAAPVSVAEPAAAAPWAAPAPAAAQGAGQGAPLLVLYGSNLGSAQAVAEGLAAAARARGFRPTLATLDERAGRLPTEGATLIVAASYNGRPADNAARFCAWLQSPELGAEALRGVRYAVFGCGDRTWASTYQAVPTLIDEALAAHGAERLAPRGEGDAAADFESELDRWSAALWPALGVGELAAGEAEAAGYRVEPAELAELAPLAAAYGALPMRVLENRELLAPAAGRSTRHIEIALPDGVEYRAGDHLGVLPRNHPETVRRALARLRLDGDARVVVRRAGEGGSHLPLGRPLALAELLAAYVELQEPATRAQIRALAEHTACPPHRAELLALAADDAAGAARYREQISAPRVSALDLLERYPACELPLAGLLDILPPLKPRYYSIASSPLAAPGRPSLTVAVVDAPARAGRGQYRGAASTYLAGLAAGDELLAFVRRPGQPFRLPESPATPVVMVGPGTGVAPFRGFLQERAALAAAGAALGPALLFFGCRNPEHDQLYAEELRELAAAGAGELVCAFSRLPGRPKRYVQHELAARADDLWALIERGAHIYICGDGARMAPEVRAAFAAIYRERSGADAAAAEGWLRELERAGRYVADVWSGQ